MKHKHRQVSEQSGKFLDSLESFRTVWKVVWKVSGQSGKFPVACMPCMRKQCEHSWHIYVTKSYLLTFGAFLSRKRFTRFVRKVFAREILPTGKFGLFVSPQLANEMARVKKRLFWFSTRFFSSFSLQCRHFHVYVYIRV